MLEEVPSESVSPFDVVNNVEEVDAEEDEEDELREFGGEALETGFRSLIWFGHNDF